MLVSVIIPTYNREKVLCRAIDSVLQQTYKDIEIIVVDDGSTDETKKCVDIYVEQYGDKIKYIYKNNGGVSSARNLGLEKAQGEYISFLDSDDCLFPEKLERQMTEILKTFADGCYCGDVIVDEHGVCMGKRKIQFKAGNILLEYLQNKTTPNTNSWLINKRLIDLHHIRFREGCSWGEDAEFFTKFLLFSRMCYVGESLSYCYVSTANSLSSFSWDKISEDVFIWTKVWDWLQDNIQDNAYRKKFQKIIFNYRIPALIIYRIHLGIQDRKKARQYLQKYNTHIEGMDFSNGLRSLKLWMYYFKLKIALYSKME